MDEIYDNVWIMENGLRSLEAPTAVTDEQVNSFELKHGIAIPQSLVKLYKIQNGGFSLRFECFFWPIERGQDDDMTTLASLTGTYHEDATVHDLWVNQLGPLNKVFVFLGDGHFYFVLNFNRVEDGQPTVAEVTESQVRQTNFSFEQWLQNAIG